MSDDPKDKKSKAKGASKKGKSAKDAFGSGNKKKGKSQKGDKMVMFLPEEMDIYCNKITLETFIFHSKDVDYENLERMVYDPEDYTVDVHLKDGTILDLGVKIQWLLRPYFTKSNEIQIVQTKNKEAINGTFLPITHKDKNS